MFVGSLLGECCDNGGDEVEVYGDGVGNLDEGCLEEVSVGYDWYIGYFSYVGWLKMCCRENGLKLYFVCEMMLKLENMIGWWCCCKVLMFCW